MAGEGGGGRRVLRQPRIRRLVADGGWLGRTTYTVHGLTEIDVTLPRRRMEEYRAQTGVSLSMSGYLAWCLARTIAGTALNARKGRRGRIVVFDDVDVAMQFEITLPNGHPAIRSHVMRALNRRSLQETHDEIREVQVEQALAPSHGPLRWFVRLPAVLRRPILRLLLANPGWAQQFFGTVSVSAIGMFANRAGWGLPVPIHPLQLTIGGMTQRPALVDGHLEQRDVLCVTVSIDHVVVDGAPAVRLIERFAALVEAADGLPTAPRHHDRPAARGHHDRPPAPGRTSEGEATPA